MCWSVHVQQRRCVHGQLTYDKHCRLETIGELEPLRCQNRTRGVGTLGSGSGLGLAL